MKISKIAAATARRLYGLCQVDGQLDDAKLREVVTKLIESQPRDYRAILSAIQRLARIETARRTVVVESATILNSAEQQRIAEGLGKDYGRNLIIGYTINPELLGGIRIKVGDDVLDGSVKGRIDRLTKVF